ncbi:MAG: hypothetical protein ACREH8_14785 [Opitutaceae bacterium]
MAQLIFLGLRERALLRGGVLFADSVTKTYFVDLSAYPQWLVVLAGTFAAVVILWILMKLLKWTLWLLLFAVLAGGVLWSGYLLIN